MYVTSLRVHPTYMVTKEPFVRYRKERVTYGSNLSAQFIYKSLPHLNNILSHNTKPMLEPEHITGLLDLVLKPRSSANV